MPPLSALTRSAGMVLLLLCRPVPLYAAAIDLSGTVVNETMQPVTGAELYLYTRSSLTARSDEQGHFRLTGSLETPVSRGSRLPPRIDKMRSTGAPADAPTYLYDFKGRKIFDLEAGSAFCGTATSGHPERSLHGGVYLIVSKSRERDYVSRIVAVSPRLYASRFRPAGTIMPEVTSSAQTSPFSDILIASSTGTQTVRRAVTSPEESGILLQLMPSGAGNVTPGIPLFTDNGGTGDITTYGSVSDPEYSQGGACNYGSTKIRYYAAINVNQLPGDLKGQWQGGHICGRCARVSIRTREGTVRTTTVRIVDRCADENCGIDLGGAPAAELMGTAPGRYSGMWEWVSCDGADGVSDGPPSLQVKTGSGTWWSVVQVRNGPGGVAELRVRQTGTEKWQTLLWATEAENYFKVPVELLQDSNDWDIEVVWENGSSASLRLPGSKLAIENALYPLQE